MTFEQFQATRTECADLGAALSDAIWESCPAPQDGLLYLGSLYIEKCSAPNWTDHLGQFHLILGREEWISADLTELERKLYEFALGEGYCEAGGDQ